ncbi:MAG TPA: hypothetical protein VFA11_19485 [Acidimicrobiales bacterium]|nr:hypothetical protein [Acidimicrobiales bacterium]
MTQSADRPTERPEDKDLQDHKFGMTAARRQEEAEEAGSDAGGGTTEPHAGGRA